MRLKASGQMVQLRYVLDRSAMLPAARRLTWPAMTAWMEDRVKGLAGRWRIVEMDNWDQDAIDLAEPGFIEFARKRAGEFGFIAVRGWLDCQWSERDGQPFVEFSWEGVDEGDQVSGRGWAALTEDGGLTGHLFFHLGDDSGFRATPFGDGR